jgi:hypothetical protein
MFIRFLGGIGATIIAYPLTVVRTRHVQQLTRHPKYPDAPLFSLTRIVSEEGVFGLFKGLVPSVSGLLPLDLCWHCKFPQSTYALLSGDFGSFCFK